MNDNTPFQKTILASYMDKQEEALIKERWLKFQTFLDKRERIKEWIETDYQSGFLEDVFENCLGYVSKTKSTNSEYTLDREKKNISNAQKADGALIVDGKVVAVIELKDLKTKDLEKKYSREESAVRQAFGYLNYQPNAKYVIVSNFNELRFYFDKADRYERFYLFDLDFEDFKRLHTLLSYESISKNIPLEIKKKSLKFEVEISNKLYSDYTVFRTKLFENVVKNNEKIDQVKLLSLTQKLIDRIIFILFAEDTQILPYNSIDKIINQYSKQDDGWSNEKKPLYYFYKIYFLAIDKGNKSLKIEPYNGGLFAYDEILDNLIIDDDVLNSQAKILSAYNFGSDISVNILGHIFEKSITALEEITAQIQNDTFDKHKSQQKKDGAFYTPEYITKYIIDDTLDVICQRKKDELNLNTIELPTKKGKLSKTEKNVLQKIYEYREWLLDLKIIDPACGSGAFLNQALEYLIQEHQYIDEYRRIYEDEGLSLYDIKSNILDNNLYGVDINEGAVEIAKLSLWLRTATIGEPLTKLAKKIRVGNSLISDKSIVDNAFDWEQEFPEVFKKGGFDVIIGNPPYIRVQGLKENFEKESTYYDEHYKSSIGSYDIYVLFVERCFNLLNPNGKLGFILPHKFLISDFGSGIREFLSENKAVESLLHFGSEMVFVGASTYTCIMTLSINNEVLRYTNIKPLDIFDDIVFDDISYDSLNKNKWHLVNQSVANILEKLNEQPLRVSDVFSRIFQGIATSADAIYLLFETDEGLYSKSLDKIVEIEEEFLKPMLKGQDVSRYKNLTNDYYVIFPYLIEDGKAIPMSEDYIKNNFPNGYRYLKENETFLRGREKGRFDNEEEWFLFSRKQGLNDVEQQKIITPDISLQSQMSLDEGKYYHGTTLYSFIKKDDIEEVYKFYLAIFNSSLLWFFIKNTSTELRGGYFRYKTAYLEPFPIPKLNNIEEQIPFVKKVDEILELNRLLQQKLTKFYNRMSNFNIKLSKKLLAFYELDFNEFIKELKKKKVTLSLKEQDEWEDYFLSYKKELIEIKSNIQQIDDKIDMMVFELYDLDDNEIKIVMA